MFDKITEQASLYNDLEKKSVQTILKEINQEDHRVADAVETALPKVAEFVEKALPRMQRGGRLFYLGAGTSGRLGVLDASEIPPTYGLPPTVVVGFIAGGDMALRNPVEKAEDDPEAGWQELLRREVNSNDSVVGIAASGTTPYVIGALQHCRDRGILTACITSNPDAPVTKACEVPIVTLVGPEYVTGSSRMKSGTAQKMVLNMISTSLMIKLGRVKGNRMVNMQLTNKKLVDRGTRMLVEELQLPYDQAQHLLLVNGSVKKALDAFHKASQQTGKALLTLLACLLYLTGLQAQHLPKAAPEEVGLNSAVLALADSAIQAEIHDGQMPGAVLAIVRHGKMAYLKAYGHRAVYPKEEPMTTNTIFDMASCSKPIGTATSAMVLLQEGKFRLLDAVNKYIPGFQDWKPGTRQEETIRIIHLFTHTSGLPAYASWKSVEAKYGVPNPKGLMQYIGEMRRDTCPEIRMRYSCLNYITLQNIIQNISGQSLKDFAAERVFRPLGMWHTGYQPADSLLPLVAPTERQPDGSVLRGIVHDPLARICNGGISGNAGLFTCAEDMGIYVAMLLNQGEWNGVRLLSPATVKAMTTEPASYERFGRSLGWDLHSDYSSCNGDLLSQKTYGHTGYTGPSVVIDPEADLGIILLTNRCHPEDKHSLVRLRSVISNIVAAAVQENPRQYHAHYYKRLRQWEDDAPITSQDIVMLGNSLTENGGDWGKLLNAKHVVNRGIIGDEALGVLDRLDPIVKAHPKRIYLMIGINDFSHDITPDSLAHNIGLVINKIRKQTPQTELYVQSLLPINETFGRYRRLEGKTDEISQFNNQLAPLARAAGAQYVDLFPLFAEKGSSSLRKDLTPDGLHLNREGYAIWAKALKKTL